MQPAGFDNAEGVLSANYAKDSTDPQWENDPKFKNWHAFIDKYMPGANKTDGNLVYGYGVASTLVETLKRCGDDLTRANLIKQAASLKDLELDTLLPGIKINTSATDFAPIAQLQMMRFKGGKWELFGEIISGDVTVD
jgi:branched-chain amino acid transport system substrate-binding protein